MPKKKIKRKPSKAKSTKPKKRLSKKNSRSKKSKSAKKSVKKTSARAKKSPAKEGFSPDHNRTHARVPLRIKIDYFKNPGVFLYDYSRNVGRGGIFVETEKPFAPGTEINLSFVLPDQNDPVEVKGKVVWIHEKNAKNFKGVPGMGVQFDNPQGKNKEALDKFFREIDYDNLNF